MLFLIHFQILLNLAKVVFQALDYTVSSNAECNLSMDLENVLHIMSLEGKFFFYIR